MEMEKLELQKQRLEFEKQKAQSNHQKWFAKNALKRAKHEREDERQKEEAINAKKLSLIHI